MTAVLPAMMRKRGFIGLANMTKAPPTGCPAGPPAASSATSETSSKLRTRCIRGRFSTGVPPNVRGEGFMEAAVQALHHQDKTGHVTQIDVILAVTRLVAGEFRFAQHHRPVAWSIIPGDCGHKPSITTLTPFRKAWRKAALTIG